MREPRWDDRPKQDNKPPSDTLPPQPRILLKSVFCLSLTTLCVILLRSRLRDPARSPLLGISFCPILQAGFFSPAEKMVGGWKFHFAQNEKVELFRTARLPQLARPRDRLRHAPLCWDVCFDPREPHFVVVLLLSQVDAGGRGDRDGHRVVQLIVPVKRVLAEQI